MLKVLESRLNIITKAIEERKIKKEKVVGYDVFDFNNTGMLEVQKIDEANIFSSDDEAVEQAIKDGIKIIPVEELPKNFDRQYLGWVDTIENRKAIENYCK